MKINPKVTAVIRTYNRAALLPQAVESILNQTYENFELIILDDCSTDNTEDVVNKYMNNDSRIRYIKQKVNSGTGKGFNTANANARGKYVAYLDDDDKWLPDKLEKQVKYFESCGPSVGFVTGGVQYWNSDEGKQLHQWIPSYKGDVYWSSLSTSGHIFGPPSVIMIRKDVLEDIGDFREDMPRGCCQQYFRRVAKKYEIDFIEDVVLDYYYHRNAITSMVSKQDLYNSIVSLEIKIESTKTDLKKVPDLYAKELFKLAHFYYLDDDIKKGIEYYYLVIEYSSFFKKFLLQFLINLIKAKNNFTYKILHRLISKPELEVDPKNWTGH
jgi:glycosyltransferase involved in cell wall biosynthesis